MENAGAALKLRSHFHLYQSLFARRKTSVLRLRNPDGKKTK
jgi:hypothetical protein